MSMQSIPPCLDGGMAVGAAAALTEVLANLRGKLEGLGPSILRKGDVLVAELLSFAARQELKPTRVEVLPFLHSFADLMRHALDVEIDVMVQVDRDCLPWRVDRTALEEALFQLVMNANTAMPDGGQLLFRASVERQSCTEGTSLEVVDTGTGMSAAILRVAALPFFTTKERSPLSGMGLPAVAGFAAQSGGRMEMTSVVGVGTTVTLKLPTFERRVEPSSEKVSKSARLC